MPIPDPKRVADAYLASRAPRRGKTAGEVRFIKDRGGDTKEWAWNAPGPSQREIGEDFTFKPKYLKPLSICLRATLMAMGHTISAQNTFAKIKSADVSPDGALGGRGYIQKISDMRRAYMNAVEALSALSDTLYDEIKAPHWHSDVPVGGVREREEVQEILQDAEQVRQDPEGWAEQEEEEGVPPDSVDDVTDEIVDEELEEPVDGDLSDVMASAKKPRRPRGKKASFEVGLLCRVADRYLQGSTP